MKKFFEVLDHLDRRIIYLILFIVLISAFFIPGRPQNVSKPTKDVYNIVEGLSENKDVKEGKKIVLIVPDIDAATFGETGIQTKVVMEHLMKNNVKFAIMSFIPQGPALADDISKSLAQKYGKKEGVDYCNLGFFLGTQVIYRTLVKDFYSVVKKDFYNRPAKEIPMMKDIKGLQDVALVYHITGTQTLGYWIGFVRNDIDAKFVAACTGIMGADYANVYASHLIDGYINAMVGAAEYEGLLGVFGKGLRNMQVQNFGHLLIIAFIILGNIGAFVSRKLNKE